MVKALFSLLLIAFTVVPAFGRITYPTDKYAGNSTNATIGVDPNMTWTQVLVVPCDVSNSTTTAASGTARVWVQPIGAAGNGTQKWFDIPGSIDLTNPEVEIFQGSYYSMIVNATSLNTPNFLVIVRQWKDGD